MSINSIKRGAYSLVPKGLRKDVKSLYYDRIIYPLFSLKYRIFYKRGDFFDAIAIETTTHCNLRCENCPNSIYDRGSLKNRKLMDINLFKKIIHELAQINYRGHVMMHFYGEPLTDERLPELVRYTRKRLPKAKIQINSNGFLMTVQKYKNLIDSGVDLFFITQYGKIMPPGMKKVFEYLKDIPKKKIMYRVLGEDLGLSNRGGEIKVKNLVDNDRPICTYPNVAVHVDYEGNIVLCCNDYHSSIKFGNLKKQTIFEIWDSDKYRLLRKEIRSKKYRLPICRKCVGLG